MEKEKIYDEDYIFSVDEVEDAAKNNALLISFFLDENFEHIPLDKIDTDVLSAVANLDYNDFITCLGDDLPKEIVLHFIDHFTKTGEFDKLGACCFDVADLFSDDNDVESQKHYLSKINSTMREKEYLYALDFFVAQDDEEAINYVRNELLKIDQSKFENTEKINEIIHRFVEKNGNSEVKELFDSLTRDYTKSLLKNLPKKE